MNIPTPEPLRGLQTFLPLRAVAAVLSPERLAPLVSALTERGYTDPEALTVAAWWEVVPDPSTRLRLASIALGWAHPHHAERLRTMGVRVVLDAVADLPALSGRVGDLAGCTLRLCREALSATPGDGLHLMQEIVTVQERLFQQAMRDRIPDPDYSAALGVWNAAESVLYAYHVGERGAWMAKAFDLAVRATHGAEIVRMPVPPPLGSEWEDMRPYAEAAHRAAQERVAQQIRAIDEALCAMEAP